MGEILMFLGIFLLLFGSPILGLSWLFLILVVVAVLEIVGADMICGKGVRRDAKR